MFPKLIVFDFHKTLSLDKGDLNSSLQSYKNSYRQNHQPKGPLTEDSWYAIFNLNQISLDDIMPTWRDVKYFITYIKNQTTTIFGIASMIEQDALILGMMKYAFQEMEMENPFSADTVVASSTYNKYGYMNLPGKQQHIVVITKNLGLADEIMISETVLIDDNVENIKNTAPICGVVASDYFLISDWNMAQGKNEYCNYSKIV